MARVGAAEWKHGQRAPEGTTTDRPRTLFLFFSFSSSSRYHKSTLLVYTRGTNCYGLTQRRTPVSRSYKIRFLWRLIYAASRNALVDLHSNESISTETNLRVLKPAYEHEPRSRLIKKQSVSLARNAPRVSTEFLLLYSRNPSRPRRYSLLFNLDVSFRFSLARSSWRFVYIT